MFYKFHDRKGRVCSENILSRKIRQCLLFITSLEKTEVHKVLIEVLCALVKQSYFSRIRISRVFKQRRW
jgi:hypothetical protein